jgi:hypothetical protein
MGDTDSDDVKRQGQKVGPVMFCQTADGGVTKPLARGVAPSTPRKRRETRRMTALMFFRVTPEEQVEIETKAADAGLEKSSWIRIQCFGRSRVKAIRRIRLDWDKLRRYMGLINKAGNVINQYIVMHRRGSLTSDPAKAEITSLAYKAFADISDAARLIADILRGR